MKLRELDAQLVRWTGVDHWLRQPPDAKVTAADGVLFVCPGCREHSILVWFTDRVVAAEQFPAPRWRPEGGTLDDLTLSPSINLDTPSAREHGTCRWHGWIRNGEAVSC